MTFWRGTLAHDLALAQACLADDAQAWESFVALYRHRLYRAAQAITKDCSLARDIADSLWAELYGTELDAAGHRLSKLALYAGRGSLEGWLRALVAQEYLNRVRQQSRFVAFDDQNHESERHASGTARAADPQLDRALDEALSELNSEQRFLLAAYYLDGRSLGEIGRMTGFHESTVSRRLSKCLQLVRKRTIHHLRRNGMTVRQARETVSGDLLETSLDLRECLALAKDVV